MKDYQATFICDYFTISTCIDADNDEQAERYAKERIFEYSGLDLDDLEYEIKLVIMGGYA